MNKILPKLLLAASVLLGSTLNALDLTPANAFLFFQQNGNVTADDVETKTGVPVLTELYKQNVGGSEEGAFAGSYTTVFAPLVDPKGATISYDGAPDPFITGTSIWLLAKDGSHGHYLWNITGWNGVESLVMSGLYPNGGSISHVSIFSNSTTPGTNTPGVPDSGATIAMLGFAIMAVGLVRRQIAR